MNLTDVQIKEYEKYNSKDILRLYDFVGWSAYTDDLVACHYVRKEVAKSRSSNIVEVQSML